MIIMKIKQKYFVTLDAKTFAFYYELNCKNHKFQLLES